MRWFERHPDDVEMQSGQLGKEFLAKVAELLADEFLILLLKQRLGGLIGGRDGRRCTTLNGLKSALGRGSTDRWRFLGNDVVRRSLSRPFYHSPPNAGNQIMLRA